MTVALSSNEFVKEATVNIKVCDDFRPAESAIENIEATAGRERCWRCQAMMVRLEGVKQMEQSRTEECNLHRLGVYRRKKG